MDIMKPNIVWVRGRCYRLYGDTKSPQSFPEEGTGYDDDWRNSAENDAYEEDDASEDYNIESTESGRMRISFHVPRTLHSHLIGSKGAMRQRLERETKCQIRIPKKGVDEDIGPTRESVARARRRMDLIVLAARQKQQFTHFLSIPMNSADLKDCFLHFKKGVLEECSGRGVGSDIFQEPSKLHLTLGTLALLDDRDRKCAEETLIACKREIIEPLLKSQPLKLNMKGVEYMNDDPAEVDVLYGKVVDLSSPPILQDLADQLVQYFSKTGLMPKQFANVKLHVTLMNSLFRRSDENDVDSSQGEKRKSRESFDATNILKKFDDFDFGQLIIKNVDLSRRYSTSADGYYVATASVSIL